ncbi:MAG: Na/Pi cotransporter family protein [Planctomycetota bacterium]
MNSNTLAMVLNTIAAAPRAGDTSTSAMALWMVMNVVGGLGIFLLGMKYMSEGLQTIAGNRLRRMIGSVTNNRLMATGVGTGVTVLVQSSSVTTVMAVGFVNAGFMTLSQAIGVIMGANIGTTITGWILALKIGKYGLPILGLAALVFRFTRKDKLRYVALTVMGVGMIFFGLELMKDGFSPIRDMPAFEAWFHRFNADTYFGVLKCALAGCVLTMIVQSSSATLGITIGLATTGVIPFQTAAALVLGENIGTTVTAYLAGLGATTNAKRAAYAHMVFNVLGVLWITALFSVYLTILHHVLRFDPSKVVYDAEGVPSFPNMTAGIAAVHTGFNVTNTLLFLPFTQVLARGLTRLFPDREFREEPHLTLLDDRLISTPSIGIEQSRRELLRMSEQIDKMLQRVRKAVAGEQLSESEVDKIFHKEEVLDIMQKEVTVFLTTLLSTSVTRAVADEARRIIRMADEYESVSDYVANIMKLLLRHQKAELTFGPADRDSLLKLHDEVVDYVDMITRGCAETHPEIVSKAHSRGDGITHMVRDLRGKHLTSVSGTPVNPLTTVIYIDMLNAYRRVKDHAMNVAEALAGQK